MVATAVVVFGPSQASAHHLFNWSSPVSVPVGAGASDVVTADLNGDGKLDLAAVTSGDGAAGSGRVAVSLGDGAGGFGAFTTVRSGGAPTAIAAGDISGDGVADLAVANSATANVTVLLNSGTGSFTATATLAVGATPSEVVLDAVDRGRVLDVIAVSEAGDSLTVWPGRVNGTFAAPIVTTVSNPVSVSTWDVNADSMKDAVVASGADNLVRVLLGDRTGHFAAGATYAASQPTSVYLAAKMNGDRNPDLAYTERGANQVTFRLGVGNGTFGDPTSFTVDSPGRVVVDDVSYSHQDIIVTNQAGNTVDVILGWGNGTFDPPKHWAVGSGPMGLAVGAFDAESASDMAVANTTSGDVTVMLNATPRPRTSAFEVELRWQPGRSMPVGAGAADVATSDLNGDTRLDLAAVAAGDGSPGGGGLAVAYGDGNGAFTPFTTVRTGGAPVALAVADVNGDGRNDLAVANSATDDITVLLNDGAGGFTLSATLAVGGSPKDVALDLVDRGRVMDVVAVSEEGDSLTVWPGKNDGTFKSPIVTGVSNPVSLAARDINRDRSIDVVVASAADNLVRVLLGNLTGAFAQGATYAANTPTSVYIATRMNKDSYADLAYTERGANQVTYRLGVGDGTFGNAVSIPVNAPVRLIVEDVTYGAQDILVTSDSDNTVNIMLGLGDGTFESPEPLTVGTGPVAVAVGAFDAVSGPDVAVANMASGDVTVLINATPPQQPPG